MNLDLENKRALVCGSTQGIGKAVALELALLGANVT
ncbi:MAG: short-chain dehydrogenase, partial [Bacteroidia bacterium]